MNRRIWGQIGSWPVKHRFERKILFFWRAKVSRAERWRGFPQIFVEPTANSVHGWAWHQPSKLTSWLGQKQEVTLGRGFKCGPFGWGNPYRKASSSSCEEEVLQRQWPNVRPSVTTVRMTSVWNKPDINWGSMWTKQWLWWTYFELFFYLGEWHQKLLHTGCRNGLNGRHLFLLQLQAHWSSPSKNGLNSCHVRWLAVQTHVGNIFIIDWIGPHCHCIDIDWDINGEKDWVAE